MAHSLLPKEWDWTFSTSNYRTNFKQVLSHIQEETGWAMNVDLDDIDNMTEEEFGGTWFKFYFPEEGAEIESEIPGETNIGMMFKCYRYDVSSNTTVNVAGTYIAIISKFFSRGGNSDSSGRVIIATRYSTSGLKLNIHRSTNEKTTYLMFNRNVEWNGGTFSSGSITNFGYISMSTSTVATWNSVPKEFIITQNKNNKFTIFSGSLTTTSRHTGYVYEYKPLLFLNSNAYSVVDTYFRGCWANSMGIYGISKLTDPGYEDIFPELYMVTSKGSPTPKSTIVNFNGNLFRIAMMNHFNDGAMFAFPVSDPS